MSIYLKATTSQSKLQSINCKTHFPKPFKSLEFTALPSCSGSHHTNSSSSSSASSLSLKSNPPRKSIKQTTLFVEKYHVTQQLNFLIQKLKDGNLSPLQVLNDDGDWNKTQFWAVIKFLQRNSWFEEIPKIFDTWKKLERSRINEFNYEKIIRLLSEAGMTDEAALEFQNMKNYGLKLSLEVYNSIIRGYARKGQFDDALSYLNEMRETYLIPDTETYDELMEAYGKFQMYDEMIDCLKTMEQSGCSPDHITYNLLIRELSKGGLLSRMEKIYQKILSKKMNLQSSTLVAMLEAYAEFGVLEKMEKFYTKVTSSKTFLKEASIRKIARVYIENYMFSRLDDLGNDFSSRNDRTDLFWCLRLLSPACQLNKKGMNYVIREMEEAEVKWSVTFVNIVLLAYFKMKDFKQLNIILSELPRWHVEPDIVTFGVLYDAHNAGFDWTSTLKIWRKHRYLENDVAVNMDPLVFAAFGKGLFLRTIEDMYSSLEPKAQKEKRWTYDGLIDLVLKHNGYRPEVGENAQIMLTSAKK